MNKLLLQTLSGVIAVWAAGSLAASIFFKVRPRKVNIHSLVGSIVLTVIEVLLLKQIRPSIFDAVLIFGIFCVVFLFYLWIFDRIWGGGRL